VRELALRCCFLLLPDWICAGVFVFSSMFESKVSIIMAWTRVCLCACVFVCKRQVGIGGIKRVRISVQRRGGTRKRERERERERRIVYVCLTWLDPQKIMYTCHVVYKQRTINRPISISLSPCHFLSVCGVSRVPWRHATLPGMSLGLWLRS
jgi:hypothetical protein